MNADAKKVEAMTDAEVLRHVAKDYLYTLRTRLEALATRLEREVLVSVEDARWMLGAMETDVEAFQSVQLHDDARRSSEVANRLRAAIAELEPHFLADAAAAAIQAAKPEVDFVRTVQERIAERENDDG